MGARPGSAARATRPPSARATREARRSSSAEVDLLASELSRVFHGLLAGRLGGVALLSALSAFFLSTGEPARGGVTATLALGVGTLAWRDLRRPAPRSYAPRHVAAHILLILAAQLTVVALSGGIRSPFLMLIPLMLMFLALGTGRRRVFAVAAAVPLVLVWALWAADWVADTPDAVALLRPPPLFDGRGGLDPRWWPTAAASVVTVVALIAGSFALHARRSLERTVLDLMEARAAAAATMADRNRELVALAGALGHELKNPLATIQGLAALLPRTLPPGSPEATHAKVILGEARRMGGVLDELLNFSRPAAGLRAAPVAVSALLDEVARALQTEAAARGVTLAMNEVAGDPTEPQGAVGGPLPAVVCDARKVRQLLVNLVRNAVQASPEGGRVTSFAVAHGEGVRLVVQDRGAGLPADLQGRLFTVGATTKADGSGLGLVIARGIAEQHGGTLTLSDRPGGGCEARCWLPFTPPGEEDQAAAGPTEGPPAIAEAAGELTSATQETPS